ncbi:MAG: AzlD domain-containing protein [Enterobacterales bacterium endosymbiont of Blomia tropicalis]|uniref:AzlD domain-containing protein n=1 Tax=Mixta mediterraneensis TaxID=2758443 RepID=UPI001877320F|nr:AzlD domain-containing protein [Mixta mediterraneensis]MBE5253792.1 AzlD domain-containing protein [Mixta mediterraneensis]MDL4915884.1 AzlD domain-containing protein [Mixta mediterraneensis]
MSENGAIIAGIGLLAAGTYLIRFAGVRLGNRLPISERTQSLLSDAATVLLLAVASTSTLFEGQHFAGMARVLGVLFAIFLAWRKAPLIMIIIGAAMMTAILRYLGVP